MTRRALFMVVTLIVGLAVAPACRHLIRVPGGDIRIGQESEPTGPIITDEARSGALCGPGLESCLGGTKCFKANGKAVCMTEDAACEAADCGGSLCQILESFPMQAVCH